MNGVGRAVKTMKEGERVSLLIQPQCECSWQHAYNAHVCERVCVCASVVSL